MKTIFHLPLVLLFAVTPRREAMSAVLRKQKHKTSRASQDEGFGSDNMKHIKQIATLLTALLLAPMAALHAEVSPKPNIVFILADDLGYGDLACFGGKDIKTPNIDSLARDGMKFTSFYVHQRCSPSRLAFMTGSYAHRAGTTKVIYPRDRIGINPAEITTAELLKQAGYTCGIVGKWHLGDWEPFHPLNHGFDYFKGAWHVAEDGGGNGRRGRGVHGEPHCPLGNLPEVRRDRARRGQRCARFPRGEQDPPLFSLPRQSRHALPLETERKVHRHLAAPEAKAKRSNQKKTRSRLI
jgi:arylsulfatase A-like enzyme